MHVVVFTVISVMPESLWTVVLPFMCGGIFTLCWVDVVTLCWVDVVTPGCISSFCIIHA